MLLFDPVSTVVRMSRNLFSAIINRVRRSLCRRCRRCV